MTLDEAIEPGKSESELRSSWLASFPEQNPNAILEISSNGQIEYLNPAARKRFPDLEPQGSNHPFLAGWEQYIELFRNQPDLNLLREVTVGELSYQQSIYYVPEYNRLRVYGWDITERKRADDALKEAYQKSQEQAEGMEVQAEELRAQTEELEIANQTLQEQAEEVEVQTEELRTQAEELILVNHKLQESEARFRLALQNTDITVATLDRNRRYTWVFNARHGFEPEQVLGKRAEELLPPEAIAETVEMQQRVLKTGLSERRETHRVVDGQDWYYDSIVEPLFNKSNEVNGLTYVAIDITQKKKIEAALQQKNQALTLLIDAAEQLLAGGDPIARLDEFFHQASDILGLEVYVQYNLSEDGTHLELGKLAGFPDQYLKILSRLELGQAVCGTVAKTRRPMYVNDVQNSKDRTTRLIRKLGICTYACHPLMIGDRLIGTLSFGSRSRTFFDQETIAILKTFCNLVAMAIDRAQGEKALQAANEALHGQNETLQKQRQELEQAKIALENEKLRLEAVLEALPVGVTITDKIGGVRQSNTAYEQVWGGKAPETHSVDDYVVYRAYWADTGKEVTPEEWASAQAVQHGKTVIGQVLKLQRFDGRQGYVLNSASPVRNAKGEIVGSAVAIQDITRLRETEQALQEANATLEQRVEERTVQLLNSLAKAEKFAQELKKANEELQIVEEELRIQNEELETAEEELRVQLEELDQAYATEKSLRQQLIQTEKFAALARLVASVAHEINNPLQTIQNCLYILNPEITSEYSRKIMEMALAEGKRIGSLVQQLRETYRPADLEQVDFNLIDLLKDVHSLLTPQFRQSEVTYNFHSEQDPILLHGLPDQLKQVFLNILLNAVDAMETQRGKIWVNVSTSSDKKKVCVALRDNGPGIQADHIDRLFEPFFTTKTKGTGLGLSICYEIVKNHQGEITVNSQPGSGATFYVWLPVKE